MARRMCTCTRKLASSPRVTVTRRAHADFEELPAPRTWGELRRSQGRVAPAQGRFKQRQKERAWRPFPENDASPKKQQSRLVHCNDLEAVLAEVSGSFTGWTPVSIATAWHRLAKHSKGQIARIEVQHSAKRLANEVQERDFNDFGTREIANILWAVGVLRYKRMRLIRKICGNVQRRLSEFDSQGIANVVYALHMLKMPEQTKLLEAIGDSLPGRLHEFKAQEISNLVYALAKLEFRHLGLMRAVSREVPDRLHEFNAQELSNLVYSFWLMRFRHRGVLKAVCDHLPQRFPEFKPLNIANTLYALQRLGVSHRGLTVAMSMHLPSRIQELKRSGMLVGILASLSTLQETTSVEDDAALNLRQ